MNRVVDYVVTSLQPYISSFDSDCKSAGYAYGGSNPPAPTNALEP